MANRSRAPFESAYGLTALFPIMPDLRNGRSYCGIVRDTLDSWPQHQQSPLSRIPETYMARFYVLDDVPYQGHPHREEHLKTPYLVLEANFHGDLDTYLNGAWTHAAAQLRSVFELCYGFRTVTDHTSFTHWVKRCQVKNDLYFVGSNDAPLAKQLKSLYVKQAFAHFMHSIAPLRAQPDGAEKIRLAFRDFCAMVDLRNLVQPSWKPGQAHQPEPSLTAVRDALSSTLEPKK